MNGVMNNNSFKTIRYTQVNYAIYYPVVNSNLPKIVGDLNQAIASNDFNGNHSQCAAN